MRLDAMLSRLGFGSRSEVQKLIRSGAVRVDGKPVLSPSHATTQTHLVSGDSSCRLRQMYLGLQVYWP